MASSAGTRGRAAISASVLASLLVAVPVAAAPPARPGLTRAAAQLAPEPDLDRLRTELDAAQQSAAAAGTAAQQSAYAVVQARIARQDAVTAVAQARDRLSADVRTALIGDPVEALPSWVFEPDPADAGLLPVLRERQLTRRQDEVTQFRAALARVDAAQATATAERARAVQQAGDAALAADHARRLLATAEQVHAANQAIRAELAAKKKALDELNARLVAAVAPAVSPDPATQTAADPTPGTAPAPGIGGYRNSTPISTSPDGSRPDASAAAQQRVLAVLESSSPDKLPPGYRATGQVLNGNASWYGPGFIGSPTSSGVPYDPERLTCAMLAVPLGTVVRVVRPNGRSVNLLVTDHGPYAAGRILDVSMRANRVLDLGAGPVTITVLTPNQ